MFSWSEIRLVEIDNSSPFGFVLEKFIDRRNLFHLDLMFFQRSHRSFCRTLFEGYFVLAIEPKKSHNADFSIRKLPVEQYAAILQGVILPLFESRLA